jgi:heme/copper-type cytochrome/quinol oxidase subunit 2
MNNAFAVRRQRWFDDGNIHEVTDEILYRYSFDSYMIPSEELKPSQTRLLETTNPLVIPLARYASVTVTSVDVIHSFAVPSLGIKIDAVPGRLNTVSMYIMELGHFYGQCSELCGVNHGFMPIEIYCVDMVGFAIYKAALSSSIVSTTDFIIKDVDTLNSLTLGLGNKHAQHA